MDSSFEGQDPGSPQPVEFPCRQCGADLHFAPGTQALTCPYCGHEETIKASTRAIVEYDLQAGIGALAKARPEDMSKAGRAIRCGSCGAVAVVDTQAQRCAFCDAPSVTVLEEREGSIRPESLLPFALEASQAKEKFAGWISSRWFAPNKLKRRARAMGMNGVYLPYWTYDSQTHTRYSGYRGDHYVVMESYTDSQGHTRSRAVQRTRWTSVQGRINQFFDDVLVPASGSLDESLAQALQDWDLKALVPFEPAYLSGFVAERYQLSLEQGFERAKEMISVALESSVRIDIGGDAQRISDMRTSHSEMTFKHILLPVWLSSYRFEGEVYQFAVNAQTGEVVGRRPYSWIKITAAVVMGIAVVVGVIYLVRTYGGGG